MVCKEVDRYLPFSPKLPLWRHFRNYRKNWQPPALTSTFWRVVYINTLSLQCLSIRLWHLMKTYIKWGLSVTSITQRLTRAGTLTVNCTEARERTGVIRFEYHKHFIWSRVESFLGRRMSSVKNSQFFRSCVFTIIDEQTVRINFVFQREVEKNEMNLLISPDDDLPGTVLSIWIIIWVVWWVEGTI